LLKRIGRSIGIAILLFGSIGIANTFSQYC